MLRDFSTAGVETTSQEYVFPLADRAHYPNTFMPTGQLAQSEFTPPTPSNLHLNSKPVAKREFLPCTPRFGLLSRVLVRPSARCVSSYRIC